MTAGLGLLIEQSNAIVHLHDCLRLRGKLDILALKHHAF